MSVRSAARKPTVKLRARAAVSTAILEAAEEVAAVRGLEATSTAAIAERAGVAVGTLYNYFVDRDGLVSALFKWRREHIVPAIVAAAAATRALPFEQRIRQYLTKVVEVFESYRRFIRVAMSADTAGIKVKGRSPAVLDTVTTELQDILRPIAPDHTEEYARMLFGGLKGLLNWRVENDKPMTPDVGLVVDTFLSRDPAAMTAAAQNFGAPAIPVNKWLVAVSIAFGSLMATIDSSIVNVAMPNIRGELGASIQEITWISTAYMVAMVLVMPLTGFLGGFFGQKRIYLLSMVTFVAGSALCGTARSLPALVFYRILQGLGGGALQPTQQAILRQTFPPEEQGIAMAMFAMVVMIGPAVGPVLGGYITDNYSWPWIFYINLPVGLIGILMTIQNVHEPDDVRVANRARAEVARKNLDIAGIVLMVVGVGALQYLFEEGPQDDWFDSMGIRIAAFLCVLGIAGFIIRELTATSPVVNLRLFKDPTFASATIIAFVMFGMLMGSMFLLPVFAQESLHYTATLSGIVLMPRTLAMMAVSPFVGRLYNKVQPAFIVGFGVILFAIGSWQLSHISIETSSRQMIFPLVVTGAAFACLFVPLTTAALSKIDRHLMADAAGLNSFMRQVGGSVGLTIFATMFTNYAIEAKAGLAAHVTMLRPEFVNMFAQAKAFAIAHGTVPFSANVAAGQMIGKRLYEQATVLSFDRVFMTQGVLFLAVIPLLFFLRVPRTKSSEKVHVELPME